MVYRDMRKDFDGSVGSGLSASDFPLAWFGSVTFLFCCGTFPCCIQVVFERGL